MQDGGLRQIFHKNLPQFHWTSIETGGTGRGIPDDNFCADSIEGWVEYKQTETNAVGLRPEQIGWMLRRSRAGGRTFIAVRHKHAGGPRKGRPTDAIYIFNGADAIDVKTHGLNAFGLLCNFEHGPAKWDWPFIAKVLVKPSK